jgi:CDGSH-type Zn-finger protein
MSEKQERKLCKCGKSNDKPYCDGSHSVKKVDFTPKTDSISDKDFDIFMKAFLGGYKSGGYLPE